MSLASARATEGFARTITIAVGFISPPLVYWLVVSTPLKNISQMGLLFPIYGRIQNVPNHQPDII